ncbi:hypothetical protein GCM10007386_26050 [Pseudoduganella dura]|nr:hypothetical protein GCM10007386_26050 [Pseudoduganella dura]
MVVPVVPVPVVPVVPVPVLPAPERVMPVPDVSELPGEPVAPVVPLPEVPDVAELPEVPLSDEPDVAEPLAPEVAEGGVLFMPLVPLAPRHESVPPVLPAALVPDAPDPLVAFISVELEPAVPLAPDVVVSWLPVLRCVDLVDLCFLSVDVCLSAPAACEPVEVDCAATPALTSIAARSTVSFVFMKFSLCLPVHTAN